MQRRFVSCGVCFLYIVYIKNVSIVLGGGRANWWANEVEWGEVHRYRVSVGPLFGKFVGFVMTKDNILHLNFLYHNFMWCMLDIENYSGY